MRSIRLASLVLLCGCSRYGFPTDADGGAGVGGAAGGVGSGGVGSGGVGSGGAGGAGVGAACDLLAGAYEGVARDGAGALVLASGASRGVLTSAVCDAGAPVVWLRLALATAAPYGKPLGTTDESAYPSGAVDPSGLVGLWHLDGALGPVAAGAVVASDLPGGAAGLVQDADGTLSRVAGRLGQGLAFDGVDDLVTMQDLAPFQFGAGDFTLSAWVRTTQDCTRWCGFLGRQVVADGGITLEVGDPDRANCFLGYLTGAGDNIQGGVSLADGLWHHLAGVRRASAGLLYVDGELAASTEPLAYVDAGGTFDSPHPFEIGGYSDATSGTGLAAAAATLDEVSVWRRALDAAEVRALHRRAALRVSARLRVCDDPGCTGVLFAGPGGGGGAFDEQSAAEVGGPTYLLDGFPVGRWAQVELTLESDVPGDTPVVTAVEVVHE